MKLEAEPEGADDGVYRNVIRSAQSLRTNVSTKKYRKQEVTVTTPRNNSWLLGFPHVNTVPLLGDEKSHSQDMNVWIVTKGLQRRLHTSSRYGKVKLSRSLTKYHAMKRYG
jgi:hypothetical protein